MRSVLRLCLSFISSLLLMVAAAQAQHDIVQPSLIHLVLNYTPGKDLIRPPEPPQLTGVQQTKQGTGFLVSDDGFILTSHHLFEDLIASEGKNVKLTAFLGEPGSAFDFECVVVNTLEPLDLVLLKIRTTKQADYIPVKLGRTELIGDQPIFSSGFHNDQPFELEGKVVNTQGPPGVGYLWAIDMTVATGQSGSPVYLADGTVVGMLKGESNTASGIGYMIPIQYADALIAHLRMATLENRLAAVETSIRDVGGYYAWSAELNGGRLIVSYKKLIKGDPQVKSVLYSLIPFVEKETGETLKDSPLAKKSGEVIRDADGKGGQIVIEDVDELINTKLSVTADAVRISALDVVIVPTTEQDEKLPPTQALHVTVVKTQ